MKAPPNRIVRSLIPPLSLVNRGKNLKISITVKHGHLTESVQETIRKKVDKLPRFFDRTTGAVVLVDLADTDKPKVELKISAEQTEDFFASDKANNVIAALDSVVHKIERQLKKHKEKLTDHRGGKPPHESMADDQSTVPEN